MVFINTFISGIYLFERSMFEHDVPLMLTFNRFYTLFCCFHCYFGQVNACWIALVYSEYMDDTQWVLLNLRWSEAFNGVNLRTPYLQS